ncbi:MAG TPA: hypothetical protein VNQ33_11930 [Acidimicrobiales bacterium]|nr:hypothetical protein [Acidimicrobiales bacterium]
MLLRHRTLVRTAMGVAALSAVLLTACEPTTVPTKPGTQRVLVLGDSIPSWLIKDGTKTINQATTTLVDGTLEACDGARSNPPARAVTGKVVPTPAACAKGWPSMYPPYLKIRPDVAIVMTSTHAMLDHQLDGTWRHPCHAPAHAWYQNDMAARLAYLKSHAGRVVVVLPAWPGTNSGWIMPKDSVKRADCVRADIRAAARTAGVTAIDFGAYLCPDGPSACKPWRTKDGMHIDPVRAPSALGWVTGTAMQTGADAATSAVTAQPVTTTSSTTTSTTTTTTSMPVPTAPSTTTSSTSTTTSAPPPT